MGYFREPDSHTRDKIKVVLELSNYATKNNQSMLQVLIHLIQLLKQISLKEAVNNLGINKLVNVPNNLNI